MDQEMPSLSRIDEIRLKMSELKGQKVHLHANMGRSRTADRPATIAGTHPSLFTVEVSDRRGRVSRQSFQYVDILTGSVQLFDLETEEPLFDYVESEQDE